MALGCGSNLTAQCTGSGAGAGGELRCTALVVVVVVVGNNLRVITLSPLLRGQHNQPTGNHSSSSYKHVSSYHHLISSYKHISSYHLISSYKHVSSYHHLISSSQNIGGKNHSRSIRCESRLVAVYQTNGESDLTKARLV